MLCATDADNGKAMFLSIVGVFFRDGSFSRSLCDNGLMIWRLRLYASSSSRVLVLLRRGEYTCDVWIELVTELEGVETFNLGVL